MKVYTLHRPEPDIERLEVVAKSEYDKLMAIVRELISPPRAPKVVEAEQLELPLETEPARDS